MLPESWKRYLEQQRKEREDRKLGRKLRPMRQMGPARVLIGARELINFASNDYLGLAADLRIAEAAAGAAGRFGWGAGASRLVTGSSTLHARLEAETAEFRGTSSALVFGSGYQANLGVISGLAGHGDTVLSDALNHASIVAGCRLSGAAVKIFKHGDYDELERRLNSAQGTRCLVVTDSMFSIRGGTADLPQLVKLCERFRALLVVDDAHGNAALGKRGRGIPEMQGVLAQVPVVIGTYSKALGSYGGFVACDEEVREHLVNSSRPFIYTTALPIALVAANIEALKILRREGDTLRQALAQNIRTLRQRLAQAEFAPTGSHHIVGLPMDSPEQALFYGEQLEAAGMLAQPMRWPSVPEGEDTLRISLSAAHTDEDLSRLVAALKVARDRTVGKDTSNVNQRSARRPTRTSLEAEDAAFELDETGFETEDDSHPSFAEPMLAADSGRLPNAGDLEDFEPAPPSSGTTIIHSSRVAEEQPESAWPEVADDGDLREVPEPEPTGFEVLPEDAEADTDSSVQATSESGRTLPPEPVPDEVADPVIANIDGTRRTGKHTRKRTRRRTRMRGND